MLNRFNLLSIAAVLVIAPLFPTSSADAQVTAERILPGEAYTPGLDFYVTITIRGESGGLTVTETPPLGWSAGRISNGGERSGDSVVWALGSVSGTTSVGYMVEPPGGATDEAVFSGYAGNAAIGGMSVMRNPLPLRFGAVENIGPPINSAHDESSPYVAADGKTLFFGSTRPGGYGGWDIWIAERSQPDGAWSEPVNAGPLVNTAAADYYPCISTDGLTLYYSSERKDGFGSGDIWVSTRASHSSPWEEPVNSGGNINTSHGEAAPRLSNGGLKLYFRSMRPDGYGQGDIWVSARGSIESPWEAAVNLGTAINGSHFDCGTCPAPDSLSILFHSNRGGGLGGFDFYLSTRDSVHGEWSAAINLGSPVNTPRDDYCPFITADGTLLYFSDMGGHENRPGRMGGWDIWRIPIMAVQSSAPHWSGLK